MVLTYEMIVWNDSTCEFSLKTYVIGFGITLNKFLVTVPLV
jgi:hypothetical protein